MTEKSGLDLLNEILFKVDILTKKVDILDQNIKKVANSAKLSELLQKASEIKVPGWTKPNTDPKGMRFKFETADESKLKSKGVRVRGKMVTLVNNQSVPLSDITVKIFDPNNKLVKETKTNKGGSWLSQLPSGKYVAEFTGSYKNKELVPINKIFEVPIGVEEFEVK
mgnify:CR=1 FL=1